MIQWLKKKLGLSATGAQQEREEVAVEKLNGRTIEELRKQYPNTQIVALDEATMLHKLKLLNNAKELPTEALARLCLSIANDLSKQSSGTELRGIKQEEWDCITNPGVRHCLVASGVVDIMNIFVEEYKKLNACQTTLHEKPRVVH